MNSSFPCSGSAGRITALTFISAALLAATLVASAETVVLRGAVESRCSVELEGARITSLALDGHETIWNADPVQLAAKDWAHGGVPVCWPWFGVDEKGGIHGYAWRRRFCIRNRRDGEASSEINLYLNIDGARLDYRIALSDALTLELLTTNTGTNDFRFSVGLHPYFLVAERDRATVRGLDGLPFEDDPSRPSPERGVWHGILSVTASVDRIFKVPSGTRARSFPFSAWLVDGMDEGEVCIEAIGASDVNVWNPGVEKNCPGLVPGDSWRRFVCVEPILVGPDGKVTLKPGESRLLKMTVSRMRLAR